MRGSNSEFLQMVIVVSAALLREDGRVLVQKRAQSSEHGGLWEFPGGKIEDGEGIENALAREIWEELGIGVETGNLMPVSFSSTSDDTRSLLLLLYLVPEWSGTIEAKWSEYLKWCFPDELYALEMPPADVPLIAPLERLVRMVQQENVRLGRPSMRQD
jgi:8-oxo-dGTP diphosphatase